ncbi:uncharacterized protein MYCFIDRAFT_169069 [Pseudocercospora fijiensis CIRAD86]|uniref:Uncharacterized protein n=1 Tax=Pseudocercospora fijiensis (strain CIRAD86) TaxID=383855 RepID=N1Q5K4_PSEFD|nr:uncharacterized protein MYCFIDRAFT_169069 [Pseudocercospora fijiensis CIRAD86]EME87210.1 hypothetical protein MYCFIDRAFT_169069 [Pseudocercospora fijiensis CIRAD86]
MELNGAGAARRVLLEKAKRVWVKTVWRREGVGLFGITSTSFSRRRRHQRGNSIGRAALESHRPPSVDVDVTKEATRSAELHSFSDLPSPPPSHVSPTRNKTFCVDDILFTPSLSQGIAAIYVQSFPVKESSDDPAWEVQETHHQAIVSSTVYHDPGRDVPNHFAASLRARQLMLRKLSSRISIGSTVRKWLGSSHRAEENCTRAGTKALSHIRALHSPGCLEALVDDQRLRELLFPEDPERDSQTDNEFLLYLSGETGRLPDLLVASIQARHVIYEGYAIDDKMEGEYNARVQRMDDNAAAIEECRRANVPDEDPQIHEKLQADAQMAVQLREYVDQWQALEDSLKTAFKQAHIYDSQVMRAASEALRGTELLEGRTDLSILRRQLFEGEKVPFPSQATSSINSEAAADETQDDRSQSSPQEAAKRERNKAWKAYVDAQALLEEHLKGYHAALDQHNNGQDPGIAGWKNSWSTVEFDLNRLQHGQEMTRNAIESENRLLRALKQMKFAFPDQADDGEFSPKSQAETCKSAAVEDSKMKPPPSTTTIYLRTPKNWESESVTAGQTYGKIFQKIRPRGPGGGTLEAVSEFEESEDAFKHQNTLLDDENEPGVHFQKCVPSNQLTVPGLFFLQGQCFILLRSGGRWEKSIMEISLPSATEEYFNAYCLQNLYVVLTARDNKALLFLHLHRYHIPHQCLIFVRKIYALIEDATVSCSGPLRERLRGKIPVLGIRNETRDVETLKVSQQEKAVAKQTRTRHRNTTSHNHPL